MPLDDFTPTSEANPAGNEALSPPSEKKSAWGNEAMHAARLPKLVTSLVHANKKFMRQANLHAQQK
jgi:hypothetical protein